MQVYYSQSVLWSATAVQVTHLNMTEGSAVHQFSLNSVQSMTQVKEGLPVWLKSQKVYIFTLLQKIITKECEMWLICNFLYHLWPLRTRTWLWFESYLKQLRGRDISNCASMPREPALQTQCWFMWQESLLIMMLLLLPSSGHVSELWGGFCPVCDKRQLFTPLHLTYSLTPRSLSPTPTSPCSPCSPLHAFHFWR